MMASVSTSPTLDEPPLPEFSRATLLLENSTKTIRRDNDLFVDLVDLSNDSGAAKTNETQPTPARKRRNTSPDSSESTMYSASPLADVVANGYFSSRNSLLERALHDCKRILLHGDNGPLLGSWLLTLVDHWDNEKERLVLLCGRSLLIVKYDFIALVLIDHMRLPLNQISHITIGRLEYPTRSITPKVQQVADRLSSILRNCLKQLGQEAGRGGGLLNISSTWRDGIQSRSEDNLSENGRREREGVRIMWSAAPEPKLAQMWNPWSKDIPWLTFVSHPLLSFKANQHDPQFDVQDFISNIRDGLRSATPIESAVPCIENCLVEYKSIVMDSYIGLPALVHNFGQLGYYKVRGKVSF